MNKDDLLKILDSNEINKILPLLKFLAENDDNVSKNFKGIGMYPTESFDQTISKISKKVKNGSSRVDVIKNNDRIIGFIQYTIAENIGEINYIVILPEFKGKGYGKILFERALNYFETQKVKRVDLGVVYGNDSAKMFYEKYGFKTSCLIMTLKK